MWCMVNSTTCSSLRQPQQLAAQQRPAAQVERPPRHPPRQTPDLALRSSLGVQAAQIHHRQAKLDRRRGSTWTGLAVHLAETSCAAPRAAPRSSGAPRASAASSSRPCSRTAPGMLYWLLPPSSWSRNQSRCCANDSGSRARSASDLDRRQRPVPAAAPATRCAQTLRPSDLEQRPQRQLHARRPRAPGTPPASPAASGRRGRRSCPRRPPAPRPAPPPRSRQPRSSSRARRHVLAALTSPCLRRRQRPAVHLAVRRQRQRVQQHERRRHHVVRQPRRAGARAARAAARRLAADHVGHQPLVARPVLARQHHRLAHRRMRRQRRLDLAQLDAEAAHLDLVVDAAQELQRRRPAASAPGRRSGTAARPARRERIGHEPLRRQLRPVQIAARQARAAEVAARPARPTGTGCSRAVQHVGPRVGDRPADRRRRGSAPRSTSAAGRVGRVLRRAVEVAQPLDRAGERADRVGQRARQRLARQVAPSRTAGRQRRRPAAARPDAGRHRVDQPYALRAPASAGSASALAARHHACRPTHSGTNRSRTPTGRSTATSPPARRASSAGANTSRRPRTSAHGAAVLDRHALGRARSSPRCRSRRPGRPAAPLAGRIASAVARSRPGPRSRHHGAPSHGSRLRQPRLGQHHRAPASSSMKRQARRADRPDRAARRRRPP